MDMITELSTLQRAFLKILPTCSWNISKACAAINISRSTYYLWREKPVFKEALARADEEFLDIAEEALRHNVRAGKSADIHYYLSQKGASRGYGKTTDSVEVFQEVPKISISFESSTEQHKNLIDTLSLSEAP